MTDENPEKKSEPRKFDVNRPVIIRKGGFAGRKGVTDGYTEDGRLKVKLPATPKEQDRRMQEFTFISLNENCVEVLSSSPE